MKLRIRGDTVRLRLSQADVAALEERGRVEELTHFGGAADPVFGYALVADVNVPEVQARFVDQRIVVSVPPAIAKAWTSSDQVGFHGEQALAGDRVLGILVEKDFQCLVPRDDAQDRDGFPHPQSG